MRKPAIRAAAISADLRCWRSRCRAGRALALPAYLLAAAILPASAEDPPPFDGCSEADAGPPQIEVLPPGSSLVLGGDTCSFSKSIVDFYSGASCSIESADYGGRDGFYEIRLHQGNRMGFHLRATTGADLVLVLLSRCGDGSKCVVNSPDFIGPGVEVLPERSYPPGTYYLHVDAARDNMNEEPPCGPYVLTVSGTNPTPDLQASLLDSPDREVVAGELLHYTLSVLNQGMLNATGVTAVVELPEQTKLEKFDPRCSREGSDRVQCAIGPLAVEDSESRELTVRVSSAAQGTLTAVLDVVANEGLPTSSRTSVQALTSVRQKTDLHLKISAPDTVVAGENLEYSFVVTNLGPSDSRGGTVFDELPSGVRFVHSASGCTGQGRSVRCPFGALPADGVVNLSFVARVAANVRGRILNGGVVEASDTDPNPTNDRALPVETKVQVEADLALEMSRGPARAIAGANFEYVLEVTNNGPSSSPGGRAIDILPPGLTFVSALPDSPCAATDDKTRRVRCTVAPIDARKSLKLRFVVSAEPSLGGRIVNTARVFSRADPDRAADCQTPSNDDCARLVTDIDIESDLVLEKSAPSEVFQGANGLYRFTVTNRGPSDWPGEEEVIDLLVSEALTLAHSSDCSQDGLRIRCRLHAIPVCRQQELRFVAHVATSTEPDSEVTITASIDGPSDPRGPIEIDDFKGSACPADPDASESASATSRVLDRPDLVLPFFEVDPNPHGAATLLAVQNVADDSVVVRFDYFAPDGTPLAFEETTDEEIIGESPNNRIALTPGAIRSVNLRDVSGLPQANTSIFGYAWITAIPPTEGSGAPLPAGAWAAHAERSSAVAPIAGDFLRLDPDKLSLNGGALVATDPKREPPQLCRLWSVRFSDTYPFTGGTDFVFWLTPDSDSALEARGGAAPPLELDVPPRVVRGVVFDEGGSIVQIEAPELVEPLSAVTITSKLDAFVHNSVVGPFDGGILLPVGSGTIEWEFPKGTVGNVSAVHRAEGRFSIAVPGVCLDPPEPPAGGDSPVRGDTLVLPYFEVDQDAESRTTLFAVRNQTRDELDVKFRYYLPEGGQPVFKETCPLPGRALRTVNLRDLGSAATGDCAVESNGTALATGYVEIEALGGNSLGGEVLLGGDYFRIDPAVDQAAGDALVEAGPADSPTQLCHRWSTRLIAGNGFSTDFVFYAPNSTGASGSDLEGSVYNESGEFQQPISFDPGDIAFDLEVGPDIDELGIDPTVRFGSIEWKLPVGHPGHVSTRFRSADGHSVLIPGICLEP